MQTFTATITVLSNRNLGSVEIQGPAPSQWAIHRIDGPRTFSLAPSKGSRFDQLVERCRAWGTEWARTEVARRGFTLGEVTMEVI